MDFCIWPSRVVIRLGLIPSRGGVGGKERTLTLPIGVWGSEPRWVLLLSTPASLLLSPRRKIGKVYGTETYAALVGAPGQATVYVFEYDATTGAWEETQVRGVSFLQEGNTVFGRGTFRYVKAPRYMSFSEFRY